MRVISKISVDLRQPNTGARIDAMQNDVNTRVVEISLFDGGAAWQVPEGVTASVGYRKEDNKKGIYDKLPDGTPAVQINGSVITVILAQQMLTTPGLVNACIVLGDAALNQLTSFPFCIRVAENPSADAQQSEDYIRLQWLEDKLDEYLAKAEETVGAAAQQAERDRLAAEDAAAKSIAARDAANTAKTDAEAAAADAGILANAAAGSATMAANAANEAALSRAAAQQALQGMVYVTFATDANGHVLIVTF